MGLVVKTAEFKFADVFDPLLKSERRGGKFEYTFSGRQTVKHLVESLGVPHPEIGLIHVNDELVSQNYIVEDGDQIEVLGITTVNISDFGLPGEIRFVLDTHLGKLANYLRFLGFDTLYENDYDDEKIAAIAESDQRVLLTRDKGLLMRKVIRFGYWVRSKTPKRQLLEVVSRYQLKQYWTPFKRCVRCNDLLLPAAKEEIVQKLLPLTRMYFNEFRQCRGCSKIYWKGSHYEHMRVFMEEVEG